MFHGQQLHDTSCMTRAYAALVCDHITPQNIDSDTCVYSAGDVPKWRKRMPVMSALDRVKRMMLWRAGQSAFRCHADVGLLEVEFKDLPKEYQDLLGEVVQVRGVQHICDQQTGGLLV